MQQIADLLKEIFPLIDAPKVVGSLKFGDIPGWDSMSAINFIMLTESTFKVRCRGIQIRDDLTVDDWLDAIRARGGQVE